MSHKVSIIFLMLMMLCHLTSTKGFSDTYKWTDADGNLHFSDNPTNASSGSRMAITKEDKRASPSGNAQNTVSEESGRNADESKCLNTFYSMVTTEFNKAYNELGRPKVDFDNLAKVKNLGLSRLEANVSKWPKRATFSISVLNSYISVYVYCGSEQNYGGEWRP